MARKRSRAVGMESLESRMCLSASLGWDGPGLGQATLGYNIGDIPGNLDRGQVVETLEAALQVWSDVADIQFVESVGPSRADSIDFRFGRIDGAGGALARAYLPDDVNRNPVAGDVEFDLAERWEVGNVANGSGFDLMLVAVHEIGHALGLEHTSAADSVMRAAVSARDQFRGLSAIDVDQILRLYAPGDEAAAATRAEPSNAADTDGSASSGGTGAPDGAAGTLPDLRTPLDIPNESVPTTVPDPTTTGQGADDQDDASDAGGDEDELVPNRDGQADTGGIRFRFGGRWRLPAILSISWRFGGLTIRFPNAPLAGVSLGELGRGLLPTGFNNGLDEFASPLEDQLATDNELEDEATDNEATDNEATDNEATDDSTTANSSVGDQSAGEMNGGQGRGETTESGAGDTSGPSRRGDAVGSTTSSVSVVSRFIAWRRRRFGS